MVSPGALASTPPGAETPPDVLIRRLTICFCLVALVLGALQAWTARFDMNPDGIQYLDNAAAYWHRDFQDAFNTQWSPLYPWLIGALSALLRPAREQVFPLVHLLNFLLYALSLGGFLFFLRCLRRLAPASYGPGLLLLSYSAFLYCSLDFTNLSSVVPDLLVSFFAFVAAGLLARVAAGRAHARHFAALGIALGFGYLAKAPFLLIGLFSLAITAVLGHKRAFITAALFCAIAAPYVSLLSASKDRFTFGDSAKLNLAWQVNGLPNANWQGGPASNGRPIHPTRQLSLHPSIFEFATPIDGTYPPWYDPAYWNEGVKVAYRVRDFAHAMGEQIRLYGYWLHHRQLPLLFALLVFFFLRWPENLWTHRLRPLWPLLALGAMPFGMYLPVHAESRYLAPFFVLLWTALFCCVVENSRFSTVIATAAVLLMLLESATAAFAAPTNQPPAPLHYEIAHDLHALGLHGGDQVAVVSSDLPYYWAYLADARVTLQISFGDGYRQRQFEWNTAATILATQPATFVVAPALDGVTDQPGWLRLGSTDVFAYPLHPSRAY